MRLCVMDSIDFNNNINVLAIENYKHRRKHSIVVYCCWLHAMNIFDHQRTIAFSILSAPNTDLLGIIEHRALRSSGTRVARAREKGA